MQAASAALCAICTSFTAAAQQELPLGAEGPELPPSLQELPLPDAALAQPATTIGNDDVVEMAQAGLSESTLVAVIAANDTQFDTAPRTLVALKGAGVPDGAIEAMVAATSAKRQSAAAAPASLPPTPAATAAAAPLPVSPDVAAPLPMSPEAVALLAAMIERLAAEQQATAGAAVAPASIEPATAPEQRPRAWVVRGAAQTALAPAIAEVAFTDERGFGSGTFKTLQGLAGKALAFANPALGIAGQLGGLFRGGNDQRTAVWALAGGTAARELERSATFEIEYGQIPGVDPDAYEPALVRLVPTSDNYRLVAAAETSGAAPTPTGPIIEELVATRLTRIGRGHYRVAPGAPLEAGQYALVLRPVVRRERGRRRNAESSLGQLLGGGVSQILYLTWDFSVRA